jgi:hypothetical protein
MTDPFIGISAAQANSIFNDISAIRQDQDAIRASVRDLLSEVKKNDTLVQVELTAINATLKTLLTVTQAMAADIHQLLVILTPEPIVGIKIDPGSPTTHP